MGYLNLTAEGFERRLQVLAAHFLARGYKYFAISVSLKKEKKICWLWFKFPKVNDNDLSLIDIDHWVRQNAGKFQA